MDVCLLHQYEEELTHCKKELADVRNSLLSIDHDDDDTYRETWKERFSTSRYKSRLAGCALPRSSCLLSLRPILDQSGLLHIGLKTPSYTTQYATQKFSMASTRSPS